MISHLIKKKIRKSLGLNRATNCVSGASHLPASIIDFFKKLDITIQEGYGQTENLAYATLNMLDNWKKGFIGSPRVGVEIKRGENNELLLRSNCLMNEYFKDEKATKDSFTEDGFLKTGDICEIDEHNRVKIVGRLSETFKNQSGEFVKPAPIENTFAHNEYVEHLCLIGKELVHNIMFITLSESGASADKDEVSKSLLQTLEDINTNLRSYEKIGHVIVIKNGWSPDNGYLTPTLKVRRPLVEQSYSHLVQDALKDGKLIFW